MSTNFEFDVTVRVRKRLWLSGPATSKQAEHILRESLKGGMSIGLFAKRDDMGNPIEYIIDNDIQIELAGGS